MNTKSPRWLFLKPYLSKYRRWYFGGAICVLISTILDQVAPWMTKIILDRLVGGSRIQDIVIPVLGGVAAVTVSAILLYFQRLWIIQSSRKIEYEIRNTLFRQFQRQPKRFYDSHTTGDLMSNATNDLDRVRDFMGPVILHLFRMISFGFFSLLSIFILDPQLALLGLAPVLLLPFAVNRLMGRMHMLYSRIQKNLGTLNAFVQDTVSGIQVVKAYGKSGVFKEKFTKSSDELRGNALRVAFFTSALWPFIGLLSALGILIIIWVGSYRVINGSITIGTLTAAFIYLLRLQFPMAGLGWVANLLQRSNAAMDRIIKLESEFVKEDGRVKDATVPLTAPPPAGFSLKGLNFQYNGGPKVLNNITLDIPTGSSLGIAGPVGSGKTTLIHLLCGVYMPPSGQLFLNGRPRENFSHNEWQRHFSLAPQDGFLFSQSIRDNIRFGAGNGKSLTVEQAGEYSGFAHDLPQISGGYDALLGERGINLSGGQKQRVGLARALMAQASIHCLDDTLSALDAEMEVFVLRHLVDTLAGKTLIIVSHRYSALSRCDNIIFLDQGGIAEQGTHQDLLAMDGKYARIYRKQMLSLDLEKA